MRISDWSSDVCSSDLDGATGGSVGIAGWAYITNKTLEALKPQAKRYEVHDLHCPGMSVRVSAQGQKVFSVKFRYGLDQKRMKLGVFPRLHAGLRSEERRVGTECGRTCRSRGSQVHTRKKSYSDKTTSTYTYLESKW